MGWRERRVFIAWVGLGCLAFYQRFPLLRFEFFWMG